MRWEVPRPARWVVVSSGVVAGAFAVAQGLLAEVIKQAVGGGFWFVTVVTGLVFAVSFVLRRQVRKPAAEPYFAPGGLGVVVYLPVSGGRVESPFRGAQREVERRFDAPPVVVERELPADPQRRAVAVADAYETFERAVGERAAASDEIALHLIAKLPDAFAFGQRLGYGPRGTMLMQFDGHGGGQFFGAVLLGARRSPSLSKRELKQVESWVAVEELVWPENASDKRIALVLILTGAGDVRGEALAAVRAGESEKYLVEPDDRCRAALVISARQGALPHTREAFELTVRFIQQQWSNWDEQHADDPDKLLVPAAPGSVVTALGHAFPRASMRVIEHVQTAGRSPSKSDMDHS